MTYQALARKWRPQDFSSIIGQDAVTTALRNAIADRRVAQAYLFSGIRGVGKTTAARVLAKALNCERRRQIEKEGGPPLPDPCNECASCREITAGSDLDVIEIDAATYSKVEQVRELTESLRYGPARDAYKVVVIDEIHRLSRQAFDALLKIVEEPPAHLVFIFATTEIEVVPATILSRCQEFHFRRVSAAALAAHLRRLCEAESIEASDRALRLLARAGEGSVRDSVALLDQLATFGSGRVAEEDAVRLLGGLDLPLFHDLLRSILDGESAAVSAALTRVEDEGWDPRRTHGQFLSYCRDALHAAVGADPERLDLPAEDAEQLAALAKTAGYENLLRLLNQLLKCEELVRRSETPALAVEIAWLRAAELPKLIAIEQLLAGGAAPGEGRPPGSGAAGAGSRAGGASGDRGGRPRARGGATGGRGGATSARSEAAGDRDRAGSGSSSPSATVAAEPHRGGYVEPTAATARVERGPRRTAMPAAAADGAWEAGAEVDPEVGSRVGSAVEVEDGFEIEPDRESGAAGGFAPASAPAGRTTVATAQPPARSPAPLAAPPLPRLSSDPKEALLELVSQRKQPLAARLRDCRDLRFEGGVLAVVIPRGDAWLREALDRTQNRVILDAVVGQVWGAGTRWHIVEEVVAPKAAPPPVVALSPVLEHPVVQSALDLFAGTIETIEESPTPIDRPPARNVDRARPARPVLKDAPEEA